MGMSAFRGEAESRPKVRNARQGMGALVSLPRALKAMATAFLLALGAIFAVNLVGSAPAQKGGVKAPPREPEQVTCLVPHAQALLQVSSVRQGYPRVAWERQLPGKAHLRRGKACLYACTQQGDIMALDPRNGSVIWSTSLGGWVSSAPLFSEGFLYVGNADRRLYAIDANSGRTLWFFPTQGEIISSPVSGKGTVLFFADNDSVFKLVNRLYVVDGRTGALRWSYETPNWSKSPPAVGESLAYLAGYERKLVALSMENGAETWSFQAGNIINSSPVLLGGTVACSTVDGEVVGLDAITGALTWKTTMPGPTWTASGGPHRVFLYYDRTGTLSAFLPDGKVAWTFRKEGLLFSLVREEAGEIMVFEEGGRIHLLDPGTGKRSAIIHLPFPDPVSAEAEGSSIFVASGSGRLICFDVEQMDWIVP